MRPYDQLPDDVTIARTAAALTANGITAHVVADGGSALAKLQELLPASAQVMTMTSLTLDTIGAAAAINESGRYDSVRAKLTAMDRKTQGREMQLLGAAPEGAVGSVHAVTEDGHVLIASASGSQLPAYAYGASHVIWVVGAQKIVPTLEAGMRRIHEYVFPLEDARALKAYGVHSGLNKVLTLNREATPGRLTIILVKEKLGF